VGVLLESFIDSCDRGRESNAAEFRGVGESESSIVDEDLRLWEDEIQLSSTGADGGCFVTPFVGIEGAAGGFGLSSVARIS
jgi:hypothetical protein